MMVFHQKIIFHSEASQTLVPEFLKGLPNEGQPQDHDQKDPALPSRESVPHSSLGRRDDRFAIAFQASPDPMGITLLDRGVFLDVNDSFLRTFGFDRQEVLGRTGVELGIWRPADRQRMMGSVRENGRARNMEFELGAKSGRVLIGLLSTEVLEMDGELCLLAVMRDITERKQMEEALIFNEQRYREMVESASDCVLAHDLAGNLFSLNPAAERLTGYSREEALQMNFETWVVPSHRARWREGIARLVAREAHVSCELEISSRAGNAVTLECSFGLMLHEGEPVLVQNVARDVTARKRAEERLRRSEEKFFKAFRSVPAAVSISTLAAGRILEANDSFLRLTGYSREELLGHTTTSLGLWAQAEQRTQLQEALLQDGRVTDWEVSVRQKNGAVRAVLVSTELIELNDEMCILGYGRDVTEQRLLEAQLRQAQKMEAVGRLAGGVAHDFNNLLGVIIGYSDMLGEELPASAPGIRRVEGIRKAAERAAALTRQLLAFSRQQVFEPRVLDVNNAIQEIGGLLERLIGADVRLVLELSPDLGFVRADKSQIEQVVMNLAVNARDAMPHGGHLVVRTANVELREAPHPHPFVPGAYVRIEVEDSGVGMDPETLERIFEPFFTTKELGKGTGLGLATVYGIVTQSGGYIWASSQPNRGATFQVLLPRVHEAPEVSDGLPRAISADRKAQGTILLVEDEESLRDLTEEFLRAAGYRVLPAHDGAHAYEIAREYGATIDLLLSDVVMPRMNGPALAEQLKYLRPGTPVLFMSGYSGEPGDLPGDGTGVLHKPFHREQLLEAIRNILAST